MEDETDLVVANVHGYRSWGLYEGPDGPELSSLFYGRTEQWVPGVAKEGVCCKPSTFLMIDQVKEHAVPGFGCMCGLWGYNEADPPENYLLSPDETSGAYAKIAGVVRASGVVEVHETGFRAQRLEILAMSPLRPLPDGYESSYRGCGCGMCRSRQILSGVSPFPSVPIETAMLHQVAERYGVPGFESFADMVEAFPPTQRNEPSKRNRLDTQSTQRPGAVSSWSQTYQFFSSRYSQPQYYAAPSGGYILPTWQTYQPVPYNSKYYNQFQWNGSAKFDPDDDVAAKLTSMTANPLSEDEVNRILGLAISTDPATDNDDNAA